MISVSTRMSYQEVREIFLRSGKVYPTQSLPVHGSEEGKGRKLWGTEHQISFSQRSRDQATGRPSTPVLSPGICS